LRALESAGVARIGALPYSIRVVLENMLRHEDGETVTREAILGLARRQAGMAGEVAFHPARVLMSDASGVPLLAEFAALRDEMAERGLDPALVSSVVPADLVVDHSVTAEHAGSPDALRLNLASELTLNRERYALIRWAQQAIAGMRVVPPGNGILHQINLEHIAQVVRVEQEEGGTIAFPDSLVGMDSHTTMINALGVVGWGVGGIEAASAMLGEPIALLAPEVVGVRLVGRRRAGVTATDLALALTALLRERDLVGKVVEFWGPGLDALPAPDRATLANMAPEYGATMGFFPIDEETTSYLRQTGRSPGQVRIVERYAREQRLWREEVPEYDAVLDFDVGAVHATLAGPSRPHDKVSIGGVPTSFREAFPARCDAVSEGHPRHGDVVIAAITSCTSTSNPAAMIGAGLLARNAVAKGLRPASWVKTSLSPGSLRVAEYLEAAGLQPSLDSLGFHVIGFGCMTCVGNSGPLADEVRAHLEGDRLTVAAVLSGNRNFEGRIHPQVQAAYLASPALVVAYALAGSVLVDLEREPLGTDAEGAPVFLRDLWPADEEVAAIQSRVLTPRLFAEGYASLRKFVAEWEAQPCVRGERFAWNPDSTYIRRPSYAAMGIAATGIDLRGARALVVLGDGVTTDHIAPVGAIRAGSPAGRYLEARGVRPTEFNSLASRRANPDIVERGSYANPRLRNELVEGSVGDLTRHFPSGEVMSIFEAAERYRREGVPVIVVAGASYGTGSSRDTAAKGVRMLGLRAVIAEGFERIHRSNLVGMGVLPLEFAKGQGRRELDLQGGERFDLFGAPGGPRPREDATLRVYYPDGRIRSTVVRIRLDTPRELSWWRAGGILPHALAKLTTHSSR